MKRREWIGYAAAVVAAGAFLSGCGNIRKLSKSDPEVGVHLPARTAQTPVTAAADTVRAQKIITYRKQDGTELFITPVAVDSVSGEKMMSVAIDEVVISASNRRNLVERNGKINVEFIVSVPQELQARNWQLVVDPQLLKGADTLPFDPLVYSGDRFRTMQRREYARYDHYLGRIVDSADYFARFGDKKGYFIEPFLIVLNSLPKSALAPMIIVWLGNNMKAIIITAISVAIFGMIINIYTGFLEIDKEKIILIKTLGGTKKDILKKLILPGSKQIIISNMKVNIGLCLVGVIIGEFLAADKGLGYLIIYGSQVFKMTYVSMSIVILCIISTVLFKLVDVIEKMFRD